VVAGGGVAGLEFLLALRSLMADRVTVELISPQPEFVYRPLWVLEPFGGRAPRFDLARIAREQDARYRADAVTEVDGRRRRLRTRDGVDLGYDALVMATGTRALDSVPGAMTFAADVEAGSFAVLLDELRSGAARSVVFAVPGAVSWTLPAYELALNTAADLRAHGVEGVALTLVTPEDRALALFGREASDAVEKMLQEQGVRFIAGTHPVAAGEDGLTIAPHGRVAADRVVVLPRLQGRSIAGVPCDEAGFVPTDEYGRVEGVSDVYAAGDCTTFPIKQGGVAAAQADVVAEVIAAEAGLNVTPNPFPAVLRGMLLTGSGPRYLSARVTRGPAMQTAVDSEPLWWPAAKIFSRHLAPYLAANGEQLQRRGQQHASPAETPAAVSPIG
jgi:sulfide:quinone oxidoreductase